MTVGKNANQKRLEGLLREYELEDSYMTVVIACMKHYNWNFEQLEVALNHRWGETCVSKKKLVLRIVTMEMNTYYEINELVFDTEMYAVQ